MSHDNHSFACIYSDLVCHNTHVRGLCLVAVKASAAAAAVACCAANQASLKERSKFKKETLSNIGGRYVTDSLKETGAGTPVCQ